MPRSNALAIGLCAASLMAANCLAGAVNGKVFDDLNRDGRADADEPGVAGVRVSNGRDVALTDDNGHYGLEVDGDSIVFITKPAGYMTPLDAYRLPRFHYLHRPDGSPAGLRYPGIAPTGPLPERIDFALHRQEEPASFEAILFADPQPQTEEELDYIRDGVVSELIGTGAAFGITMGDILFDDLSMFPRYNSIVAMLGIPWYNVPGNHELNLFAPSDAYSLETFSNWYGPPYYAFEYANAVFVVLDDVRYRGAAPTPGNPHADGGYDAAFGGTQLEWLAAELEHVPTDRLLVLAMHIPLLTRGDPRGVADRRALFDLLADYPNLYAMAGHTHTTQHVWIGEEDGYRGEEAFHHHVLTTVSGSWWSGPFDAEALPVAVQRDGTPRGYHRMHVDGTDLRVSFKAAGRPASHQMRIMVEASFHGPLGGYRDFRPGELHDGRINEDQVAAASVVVNLFDGGPRSKVRFRIGDGEWLDMRRKLAPDPSYLELAERHAAVIKPWVEPRPSTHLWTARLPHDLGPGTHLVSVAAIDEFGGAHHGHKVLEITGTSARR